jgi:hypothetical protein
MELIKNAIVPETRAGQKRWYTRNLEKASQIVTRCDMGRRGIIRKGERLLTKWRDTRVTTCHKKRTSIVLLYYGFHNLRATITKVVVHSNRSEEVCSIVFLMDMELGGWGN